MIHLGKKLTKSRVLSLVNQHPNPVSKDSISKSDYRRTSTDVAVPNKRQAKCRPE